MSPTFLDEATVYRLLERAGLATPRHSSVADGATWATTFEPGERVVLKGLCDSLWHKSEVGAVRFLDFDEAAIRAEAEAMRARLGAVGRFIGALVAERVAFRQLDGVPCEWFFSVRREAASGFVLAIGLGGLHAELLRRAFRAEPLQWDLGLTAPSQLLDELEASAFGALWMQPTRSGAPLVERARVAEWIDGVFRLAVIAETESIELIEVNPLVVAADGRLVALDGVGLSAASSETTRDSTAPNAALNAASSAALSTMPNAAPSAASREVSARIVSDPVVDGEATSTARPRPTLQQLLTPKRVAVIGVSSRADSVGGMILANLLRSDLAGCDGLRVIKAGVDVLFGVPALPDLAALAADPADWLIVALPASAAVDAIAEICARGGGASIVFLVAGGIGDGADPGGAQRARLEVVLHEARRSGGFAPVVVGPNSLGALSADLSLDSLFIPPDKLAVRLDVESPVALVSQSGAFLITRIDGDEQLVLRVGYCLGNQLDFDVADCLGALADDPAIRVAALYLEGFGATGLRRLALAARHFAADGRRVVLYKAGRTSDGARAAAGHTGALAGSYALERSVLRREGVVIADRFSDFSAALRWLGAAPAIRPRRVALITNAGYEAVRGADLLFEPLGAAGVDVSQRLALTQVLEAHGLAGLVAPQLPLDLTPMADEAAYCAALEALVDLDADVFVLSLVPLTRRLCTADPAKGAAFAQRLAELARGRSLTLGVVVDAGRAYDAYRRHFASAGLPVFDSVEVAIEGLRAIA